MGLQWTIDKLYPNDLTLRFCFPLLLLKEYPLVFISFMLLIVSVSVAQSLSWTIRMTSFLQGLEINKSKYLRYIILLILFFPCLTNRNMVRLAQSHTFPIALNLFHVLHFIMTCVICVAHLLVNSFSYGPSLNVWSVCSVVDTVYLQ